MANSVHRLINVDHDDNILRTFILFVQTAQAILKYADAHLYRKARLSIIKLVALQVLASSNRAMTPSELAEWTFTERHNITALVDRMRRGGLVTTEPNSSDRRLVNITVTDRGREVLSQAMPVARKIVNNVMSSLTEADAALLEKELGVLRQNAHHGLEHFAKFEKP